jgi:hypothetical protein
VRVTAWVGLEPDVTGGFSTPRSALSTRLAQLLILLEKGVG